MTDLGKINSNDHKGEKELFTEKILLNIKNLEKEHHVAFNQLVPICKDPEHIAFGNIGRLLRRYKLMNSNGTMDDAVKDIILSSITATAPWELIAPLQKAAGQEIKEVLEAKREDSNNPLK